MKVAPILIRGKHEYAFRCGEWGRVINSVFVSCDEGDPYRLCLVVMYADGVTDYVPCTDLANYELARKVDEDAA